MGRTRYSFILVGVLDILTCCRLSEEAQRFFYKVL